jgi:hypothetical protein
MKRCELDSPRTSREPRKVHLRPFAGYYNQSHRAKQKTNSNDVYEKSLIGFLSLDEQLSVEEPDAGDQVLQNNLLRGVMPKYSGKLMDVFNALLPP